MAGSTVAKQALLCAGCWIGRGRNTYGGILAMTDFKTPDTSGKPETLAEQLLSLARENPDARARLIERWARADEWTLVEGVALAWTINPSTLSYTGGMDNRVSGLSDDALHYLAIAHRSTELRRNSTPASFIEWAHDVGLAFHPDWHNAVRPADLGRDSVAVIGAERRRKRLISPWARSSYWSPADGAALAYNLDPTIAVARTAGAQDNPGIRGSADASHLLQLAYRAVGSKVLREKAPPMVFMKWARSTGVEFHPDWWAAVGDTSASAEEAKAPDPARHLGIKEQESLLKLVVGMAIEGYKWDPKATRSSVTQEIADDLQRVGVRLDVDTVRKWLQRGAELLPRESD